MCAYIFHYTMYMFMAHVYFFIIDVYVYVYDRAAWLFVYKISMQKENVEASFVCNLELFLKSVLISI